MENERRGELIPQGPGALGAVLRGAEVPATLSPAQARPLGETVAAALQAASRSEHTRRAYESAIGLFLGYLAGALGTDPWATRSYDNRRAVWAYADIPSIALRVVTPGHLDGYRAWREAEGDSTNTASQRLAAVATLLSVAYRDGILADGQALALGLRAYRSRSKRDRKPTGRRLTREEARALRAAPDTSTRKGRRDLAMLDCALFVGLRVDELVGLDMASLRQDRGRWWIVLTGKGGKTRKLKLHDALFESLTAWLADTGRSIGQGTGALFLSVNKGDNIGAKRLGTADVNRIVAEYGAAAGLAPEHGAGRLGPHDLRRTCARNAYDNGAPLPLVQAMLGHSSPDTTLLYIGGDGEDSGGAVEFVRY